MTIVSDSSSLILLTKAEILKPLLSHRELKISNTVYEETVEKGKEKAKEDAYFIEKLVDEKEITVAKPDNSTRKRIKNLFGIEKGENSTLALAIEENPDLVLVDDEKGIKVCKALNFSFAISADIAVALYETGRIGKEKSLKALERLEKYGWIEPNIIRDRRKKIRGERQ
ncbi:hypothetical protein AKJ66_04735 [candidate division MSBL1 archaeon SCGC-AAA259E22]|uniref:DUF3368 domain-containing protein n=3 Tax=candidate division MSBL1 TaxID=215777 RepID=A0A133VM10_9EURY|nr:hypothetical protein AKJ66_04735 [candidate division MSBL1 archaeon SCGC-AAA259E22]KXB05653.1 hypothetical protein AKJ50_00305 [candidate division MSBL1 archaeon SCGC-AAA382A13]KXB07505.1 hypothetical protein AKJ52_00140 [candidate division MSBL1 archaeon SCGC-AAA382C18]